MGPLLLDGGRAGEVSTDRKRELFVCARLHLVIQTPPLGGAQQLVELLTLQRRIPEPFTDVEAREVPPLVFELRPPVDTAR
jgi:hypothetical protein